MEGKTHLFEPAITSCNTAGCHAPATTFPTLAGKPGVSYTAINTALLPALLTEIQSYAATTLSEPITYDEDSYPYWFNSADEAYRFDAKLLKAAYNYQTGLKDPGGYIHNGDYIQQILFDSITDLGGAAPGTRPLTP